MKFLKKSVYLLVLMSWVGQHAIAAEALKLKAKVIGIEQPILKNVEDRFAIVQDSYGEHPTFSNVRSFYKNGGQNILQAVKPYGYFKAKITKSYLTHQGNTWTAIYVVSLGPALKISHLDIKLEGPGADNKALNTVIENLSLQEGKTFKAEDYEKAKSELFQTANEQGYLKAYFEEQLIKINLEKYTANIILHFNTRARYYFGAVHFKQDVFSEKFLRRYMHFREGQHFSSKELTELQQNLNSTNYFSEVSVTPLIEQEDNYAVPVEIDLKPSKTQQYNAGVGYGTSTGVRLSLDAKFRRINRWGHNANLQVKASKVLGSLAAQYIIPGSNPLTDQYSLGANTQIFSPKNGRAISKTLSFGYLKALGDWKFNSSLNYLKEHYNITNRPSHNSHVLYPNLEITHLQADDLLNTHYGHRFEFLLRAASREAWSSVTFAQAEIKGKYIFSPTEASRVILRGDLGYITVNDYDKLPISLQFYAGGLDSLRGFRLTNFGPGRYIKIGSVEYQHRIYGNLNGAVFYDVGVADEHFNAPVGKGIGIGIIYNTLVGPVKVYSGFGYEKDKPRHFSLEFSIGPDL